MFTLITGNINGPGDINNRPVDRPHQSENAEAILLRRLHATNPQSNPPIDDQNPKCADHIDPIDFNAGIQYGPKLTEEENDIANRLREGIYHLLASHLKDGLTPETIKELDKNLIASMTVVYGGFIGSHPQKGPDFMNAIQGLIKEGFNVQDAQRIKVLLEKLPEIKFFAP